MAFPPPTSALYTFNIYQASFDVLAANISLLSFKVTACDFEFQGCFLPVCVAVNNKNPRILFFLLDITALACIVGRGERKTRILLLVPLGDRLGMHLLIIKQLS